MGSHTGASPRKGTNSFEFFKNKLRFINIMYIVQKIVYY
jgi:hypothetical protein